MSEAVIARAAAALVSDGDVVLIDGGTTTLRQPPWLAKRVLRIVTNSILISPTERATPQWSERGHQCAWGGISRIITDCGPEGWEPDLAQDRLVIVGML